VEMPGYKWNGFMARLTNKFRYRIIEKTKKKSKATLMTTMACVNFSKIIEGNNLLYQDELITVFKDIKEDALFHCLVVPNKHIPSLDELTMNDMETVQRMEKVGVMLLEKDFPNDEHRIGYHHPPRNSIEHLHMHCIVLPFKK
jgi:Diadenosine tetraphosphate (Ap4A) hydrolase and other HIT family hydrolases